MFAFLTPFLIKTVLPFIVQQLVKDEIIPAIVGDGIVDYESLKTALKNLKVDPSYPEQKANFTPVE